MKSTPFKSVSYLRRSFFDREHLFTFCSFYGILLKINELCHTIQELNLNKYLIQHLEYAYGVDLKNTDTYTLKNYLDNIYTIEASNNIEFAQNFIYEFYFDQIEALPWEISYSIDYETLYKKLEMTMNITKNEYENIYYYSNN